MKTTYEQLLEMNREEDEKKKESSAIAFLEEGVSVEIIAKCLEIPKKKVRELAKSLKTSTAS